MTATIEYGVFDSSDPEPDIERLRYHPYGDKRGTTEATAGDRTYTGQIDDTASTGLMYYNARYYDPALRTFISPDTIIPNPASSLAWNRYTYVNNNPVNLNDPSGHCPQGGPHGNAGCAWSGPDNAQEAQKEPPLPPATLVVQDRERLLTSQDDWRTNPPAIVESIALFYVKTAADINLDPGDDSTWALEHALFMTQSLDMDGIMQQGGLSEQDVRTQFYQLAGRESLVGTIGGPHAASHSLEYRIYMLDDGDQLILGIVDRDVAIPVGATEVGANTPVFDTGNAVRLASNDFTVVLDIPPDTAADWAQRLGAVPGSHRIQYNAIRYHMYTQPLGPHVWHR